MIVNFSFSYGFKPDQETVDRINKYILGEKLQLDEKGEIKYWNNYTANLNDILEITSEIRLQKTDNLSLEARLINTIERLAGGGGFSKEQQFNERVNVHISDIGLLKINEVQVLTNECTEDLQKYLDDGWHIVAVCPQPDQRRPDYIIGRTK